MCTWETWPLKAVPKPVYCYCGFADMAKVCFAKLSSVSSVLSMNKAGPSGRADQTLRRFVEAHPYFHFYSRNWDQMASTVSVTTGSPSRGGDVAVYVIDINQLSMPTPFCSLLVSVPVFKAPSTVFHFIYSPDNSPLSHSVLPVFFLPYWSFQLHISL